MPYPAVFDLPHTWSETTFALSWKVNCSTTAPVISYRLEFRESGFNILTVLFYNNLTLHLVHVKTAYLIRFQLKKELFNTGTPFERSKVNQKKPSAKLLDSIYPYIDRVLLKYHL